MEKTDYTPMPQNEAERMFRWSIKNIERLEVLLSAISKLSSENWVADGLSREAIGICGETTDLLRDAYHSAGLTAEKVEDLVESVKIPANIEVAK